LRPDLAQAEALGEFRPTLSIGLGHHRVSQRETVLVAVCLGRQAVRSKVPLQCPVWLAVDEAVQCIRRDRPLDLGRADAVIRCRGGSSGFPSVLSVSCTAAISLGSSVIGTLFVET
jgi:hypothetical protein